MASGERPDNTSQVESSSHATENDIAFSVHVLSLLEVLLAINAHGIALETLLLDRICRCTRLLCTNLENASE